MPTPHFSRHWKIPQDSNKCPRTVFGPVGNLRASFRLHEHLHPLLHFLDTLVIFAPPQNSDNSHPPSRSSRAHLYVISPHINIFGRTHATRPLFLSSSVAGDDSHLQGQPSWIPVPLRLTFFPPKLGIKSERMVFLSLSNVEYQQENVWPGRFHTLAFPPFSF